MNAYPKLPKQLSLDFNQEWSNSLANNNKNQLLDDTFSQRVRRPSIRTIVTTLSQRVGERQQAVKAYKRLFNRLFRRSRKRIIRYGLLSANLVLLIAVVGFVVITPNSGQVGTHSVVASNASTTAANPLDQLSSADIAVHIARMASLPESTAVVNQADTVNGQLAISSADDRVIAKPQVVATALKSKKDIQKYTTAAGDTLASIATKFNVTSDSIKWSNGLSSATIQPGTGLVIPPVNGIVYTVKAGDTAAKLAKDYSANEASIVAFNDAEVGGLKVGEQIVIPDGTKAAPMYVATAAYSGGAGFAWGSAAIYGYNGYEYGWCTWYVASKVNMPANWGNANTWARYARTGGWTVSKRPVAGAIGQNSGPGLGHVALVEAVSEDGSMIKYSDMNGLAGWGRVGYSDWVSVSKFENYIYH